MEKTADGKGVIADKMYWNSNNYELILNDNSIPPNLVNDSDLQAEVDALMPITKKLHLIYKMDELSNEDIINVCMSLTIKKR